MLTFSYIIAQKDQKQQKIMPQPYFNCDENKQECYAENVECDIYWCFVSRNNCDRLLFYCLVECLYQT